MTDWEVPAKVERVVDGDTILAECDLGWHVKLETYVRLYGVNAPELATDEGKAARDFVKEQLPVGTPVTVVSHKLLGATEKYGRALASVTLPSGRDLSTVLLETEHAVAYDGGAR